MEGSRGQACFCLSKGRGAEPQHACGASGAPEPINAMRVELEAMRPAALTKRAQAAGADEVAVDAALDDDSPKSALVDLILELVPPPPDATDALRSELEQLKPAALLRRAKEADVDEAALDEALDADDPKSVLIDLLLQQPPLPAAAADDALRAELGALKVSALRKRALSGSVDAAELEGAMDSDDPHGALVDLLLAAEAAPAGTEARRADRPHFGAAAAQAETGGGSGRGRSPRKAPSGAATSTKRVMPASKHVMLSYQWDHQRQVTRAHDLLVKLGLKVWMDISGGMGSDIYDSMAEGVSNAFVVVAFMSQKYQDSENCMLELKFAKQSGVEIIPVMMEGGGWRASGWLGLLTAGSLWTRMTDESQLEENVGQLHGQIQKVMGHHGEDDLDVGLEDIDVGPSEAKEELDRLRDDLVSRSDAANTAVLADPSQPATIPAGVPKLPPKFQATEQIETLTRLVLSTRASDMSMSRVGFWGMGGIGKTVTGAAIVRNAAVRQHFDAIVWLPLGQTPVISKLQNLCHMQCTGKELSSELSSEEKKEALQQAMAGKRVLLVLDDLWEEEHEPELNVADVSSGSKVLISTRVEALLAGAHQVKVGLPSPSDSARMLLAAAGVDTSSSEPPRGVPEIVDLCGRLPLALGIAGRLAASLGLCEMDDWSSMIGVLKEELHESHSGGTEEGMIRASLRGLKGSAAEQANVKSLLLLFAMVPEDTHCPLEALLLMFEAVHPGSGATMMHVRKWLRILVNRSLVLGTVDRPSVHDLVQDFAIAQHTSTELRENHTRIVEAFRASRPVDAHSRSRYDAGRVDEPLDMYVCAEGGHHCRQAMKHDDSVANEWLLDLPQDALAIFAAKEVGLDNLEQMATQAERRRDFWLAAQYWSLVRELALLQGGIGLALEPAMKSLNATTKASDVSDTEARDDLRLAQARTVVNAFDVSILLENMGVFEEILATRAATREPAGSVGMGVLLGLTLAKRADWEGDCALAGKHYSSLSDVARAASDSDPEPQERLKCLLLDYAALEPLCQVIMLYADSLGKDLEEWWDTRYGADGERLLLAMAAYDYRAHHDFLIATINSDWLMAFPTACLPLMERWVNVAAVDELIPKCFANFGRILSEPDVALEHSSIVWGSSAWAAFVYTSGLSHWYEKTAALMGQAGMTYHTANATLDSCLTPWIRKRGDDTKNVYFTTAECFAWAGQMTYVLVASDPGVSPEEVIAALPTIEDIVRCTITFDEFSQTHALFGWYAHLFYLVAAVCEKLGSLDKALHYIDAGLSADLPNGGTQLPNSRTLLNVMRGRVLASLGRSTEAASVLEASVEMARKFGFRLFELYALRDLKLLVLDPLGHADHGSRRIGALLRQLKGPLDKVTPLLKGLDAEELAVMLEPDGSYNVVYEPEDRAKCDLRTELSSMKLKALKKRARKMGVDEERLADADDADDVRATVIELAMACAKSQVDHDRESRQTLKSELGRMKVKALKKRARAAGVAEDRLEDADDADDIKGAVVGLIIEAEISQERPHFGSGSAARTASRAMPASKHVMLSYQWDHQRQVTRAHDLLVKLGLKVWMDISGGMGSDIYDSMAEGVTNAFVVVAFMSQKYQDSENCMLELKFAKQSGVEIIPVMMEGGGWRASGWLGLLTAGSLWTRMTDESQLEENVGQLHGQIQKIAGVNMADVGEELTATTPSEAKEELGRLRDSLARPAHLDSSVFDPDAPAALGVGVPELPTLFRRTKAINELSQNLLHNVKPTKAGFFGQGGIGKTVTGAALVRDDAIRHHFDQIVWLPLGQSPVLDKLQSSALEQLTGRQMEPNLSEEERHDSLRSAFEGKRVLLALDDLWEEEHATQLDFVDASCGSRVLISTRIRHVLSGAFAVEIGKPTVDDSIEILMAAADIPGADRAPPEARDVVELCGRLPLALAMAGKLITELGVGDNWDGISAILRDELRDNEQASAEQAVIRASLAGLKGRERDRTGAQGLFKLFGLVPEDTSCPLECLQLMYDAAYETSKPTSILHIRKWLKILIDRSLVLGTVDRASLHDLVLDFAIAMHSKAELIGAHRRVVEMFRATRPLVFSGIRAWDPINRDHAVTAYVIDEGRHHASNARDPEGAGTDELLLSWVHDYHDELVGHVAHALGDSLVPAAEAAEAAGEMWSAACRYHAASRVVFREHGKVEGSLGRHAVLLKPALDALAKARAPDTRTAPASADKMNMLELMILQFLAVHDLANMASYQPLFERLLTTEAARARPDQTMNYWIIRVFAPIMVGGDHNSQRSETREFLSFVLRACEECSSPVREFLSMCLGWLQWACLEGVLQPGFDWQCFGESGSHCWGGISAYNYDKHHSKLIEAANFDPMLTMGASTLVLGCHYGDLEAIAAAFDCMVETATRAQLDPERDTGAAFGTCNLMSRQWPYIFGKGLEFGVVLSDFVGRTWAAIDAWCDEASDELVWFPPRGEPLTGAYGFSLDTICWCAKFVRSRTSHLAVAGIHS
eukprot:COSAG04_NODE_205_length_20393_cov_45.275796_13_plen_2486_part_00